MTLIADSLAKPHVKRWTKDEYNSLVERGFFNDMRVYLYRGELIQMPPMGSLHANGIRNINTWLVRTFEPTYAVRIQSPFDSPGASMPEPDGAVVTISQMARSPHPNEAMLLLEVSDSSIEIDHEKTFDYAAANVADYWILDMRGRQVHVYRDVVADTTAIYGYRYRSHRAYGETATVSPLARPDVTVAVADLLKAKP